MRSVLHIVSANRWTGAAAPAFAEVEALREAGVNAHYAYVGGYKLEAKIGGRDFTHPIIGKDQNPLSFARSIRNVRRLVREHGIKLIHAHLTYDHWIARFVTRRTPVGLARTFHARRAIRSDPFSRALIDSSRVLCVVNEDLMSAPALRKRAAVFTPPPLDAKQFVPTGPNMRSHYGIAADEKVLCAIGKLTRDRGFEDVLETFAIARSTIQRLRLMIIGAGPNRFALERRAQELGVHRAVIWAGYHEEDLAEHYRSAEALLFTSRGSDEGHRAVLEAMACGLLPLVYPLEGIRALTGELSPTLVAVQSSPSSLADRAADLLSGDRTALRAAIVERSREFGYERAAQRLIAAYGNGVGFASDD